MDTIMYIGSSTRWLKEVTDWGTPIFGAIGAIGVIVGYLKQRREKKSDRASELEAALQTDPLLNLAVTILDWGGGNLPLPDNLRAYTGQNCLTQDLALLHEALRPKLLGEIAASSKGTLYRITFVALFDYMQRAMQLWQRNYIATDDISLTKELAKQLVDWDYAELGGHPAETWFLPAMKVWYPNVYGRESLDVLIKRLARLQ